MKVRVCHCQQCRLAREDRRSFVKREIKAAKHNIRSTVKYNLRVGDWDHLPEVTGQFYYA